MDQNFHPDLLFDLDVTKIFTLPNCSSGMKMIMSFSTSVGKIKVE